VSITSLFSGHLVQSRHFSSDAASDPPLVF
jgi:hypothetical protein